MERIGLALVFAAEILAIAASLHFGANNWRSAPFNLGDAVIDLAGLAVLHALAATVLALAALRSRCARPAPAASDGRISMSPMDNAEPLLVNAEQGDRAEPAAAAAADAPPALNGEESDRFAAHPELQRRRNALYAALGVQLGYAVAKCLYRLVREAPASDYTGTPWFWLALVAAVAAPSAATMCALSLLGRALGAVSPPKKKGFRIRLSDIAKLCAPDWPIFLMALIGLSVNACGEALIPYLYGRAIDAVAIDEDKKTFHKCMPFFVLVAAVTGFCTGMRGSSFIWAGAKFATRLRTRLFEALLAQEIAFYDQTKTGDITSRLTADTQKVSDQVELNVNVFLRSFMQAVLTLAFMFGISFELGLLAFVTVPNIVFGSKIFRNYIRRISKGVQKSLADATSVAEEVLGTMRTVKAHHAEAEMVINFREHMETYNKLSRQTAVIYSRSPR
jgi:hypothetical protein